MTAFRYPVMEIFYTIQGEGFWSGHAAHFIRLAGCDVGCVWCDVKESWDASGFPAYTAGEIVRRLDPGKCKMVVITGGEPVMYDLTELTEALHKAGYRIHIETSGTGLLRGTFDWVCFSPKKFKKPVPDFAKKADELKVIVFNSSDFTFAESFQSEVSPACKLYLQAEWDKRETMNPQIVSYVKQHPEWQIGIQSHKYLQIP